MINIDELLDTPDLFVTEFPQGWSFMYRLLSLREYRLFAALRASNTIHSFLLYKKVFERCYCGDPNLLNNLLPAGTVVSVGNLIMYLSGDCNRETIAGELETARKQYLEDDVIEYMKRIIIFAFPNVDWQSLEQKTRPSLITLFVQAEATLKKKIPDYQVLDASKITSYDDKPAATAQPKAKPINFEEDNQLIAEQMHPFDTIDLAEKEYAAMQAAKPKQLDSVAARKLDRIRRR